MKDWWSLIIPPIKNTFKEKNKMTPYNICENKWISKAKKEIKNNYKEYQPIYEIFIGIGLIVIFVLATLTALSSFL